MTKYISRYYTVTSMKKLEENTDTLISYPIELPNPTGTGAPFLPSIPTGTHNRRLLAPPFNDSN